MIRSKLLKQSAKEIRSILKPLKKLAKAIEEDSFCYSNCTEPFVRALVRVKLKLIMINTSENSGIDNENTKIKEEQKIPIKRIQKSKSKKSKSKKKSN